MRGKKKVTLNLAKRPVREIASVGGFSTGYATVATCTVSVDDEEVGTLGGKQGKGYEYKDAAAFGLSCTTNNQDYQYPRPGPCAIGR